MWLNCKLHLNNYHPEKLEKGMMFTRVMLGIENYIEIYKLDRIPSISLEEYIEEHGFPITFSIVYEGNGNDEIPVVLANSSHIGWWDEGEDSDEYYDVTLKELNTIIQEYDWEVNLLMDDTGEKLITDIFEGKCILSYIKQNEIYDTDFEKYVNQEEEEW